MRSGRAILAFAFVVSLIASSAQAAVITFASRVAFDAAYPGATIENWDGLAAGTVIPDGSTVNGITYEASINEALVVEGFINSTNPNSLGLTPDQFFFADDSITFTFATPVTAFGIDFNTFDDTDGGYTATTNLGDVALSVFEPFPGFGTGQFLGFSSDVAFSSVTISSVGGFSYTLDTMRRVAVVPEPATLVLVGAGLVAAGLRRRRAPR